MFIDSGLILAAGMPRSASTWLYNVARLLIESSPVAAEQLSCGWVGDWRSIPKKKYMLIKVHDYNQQLVDLSSYVLYSHRDVRDAMASSLRMFGQAPTIEVADEYINQYDQWVSVADFVMRYETMLQEKVSIISELAQKFELQDVDPEKIAADIEALNYQSQGSKNQFYHHTNQFHPGHITDGRHGSWEGLLDSELVKEIEEKHQGWFEKCGYLTGS